ncbi:protein MON2 homolog isoform X2 [Artemia franciscana]|uniref:protein MON2 homolog isoform X2 n=1 Tax=Artemia franciscana TaxID=6661 RepID=UPI0032D9B772
MAGGVKFFESTRHIDALVVTTASVHRIILQRNNGELCLSAIQKLTVNGLLDEKNAKHLSDKLWMLTEGTIEEVHVLKTVTLLLTTSGIAHGITLSKFLTNQHEIRKVSR